MEKYYDVMYREDYDWWTFALAFNTTQEQIEELQKYEFSGEDDLGVTIESNGKRVTVVIDCRVDSVYIDDSYDEYEDDYEDEEDEFDIPIPQDNKAGKNIVEQFRNILN